MFHIMKPAAIGAQRASVSVNCWQVDGAEDNPSQFSRQVIRAELHGDDTATALGLTVRSTSPILALCRKLIALGHDPHRPLQAYRGNTLALIVTSIGQGAALEINAYGTGFRSRREADAAPPMRQTRRGAS